MQLLCAIHTKNIPRKFIFGPPHLPPIPVNREICCERLVRSETPGIHIPVFYEYASGTIGKENIQAVVWVCKYCVSSMMMLPWGFVDVSVIEVTWPGLLQT